MLNVKSCCKRENIGFEFEACCMQIELTSETATTVISQVSIHCIYRSPAQRCSHLISCNQAFKLQQMLSAGCWRLLVPSGNALRCTNSSSAPLLQSDFVVQHAITSRRIACLILFHHPFPRIRLTATYNRLFCMNLCRLRDSLIITNSFIPYR